MGQPILEVEHLKKSYVNNVPILDLSLIHI